MSRRRCLPLLALPLLLSGCFGGNLRPLPGLNQRLAQLGASHDPQLSGRWLTLIAGRQGRQQVQLLDLERGLPVPLPGLNPACPVARFPVDSAHASRCASTMSAYSLASTDPTAMPL